MTRSGDGVVLSELFEWYAKDFLPSPLAWIARQAPNLKLPSEAEVTYRPWDWALNDQPRRPKR